MRTVYLTCILCFAGCLTFPLDATAQVAPAVWPRCIPERDGQQLGLGGSICECRYQEGGTMIRRPPGWRWACDIMRMDGSGPDFLPDHSETQQSLPPGFVYAPQIAPQAGAGQMPSTSYATPAGPKALFDGRRQR